jgi:hypothetical protein
VQSGTCIIQRQRFRFSNMHAAIITGKQGALLHISDLMSSESLRRFINSSFKRLSFDYNRLILGLIVKHQKHDKHRRKRVVVVLCLVVLQRSAAASPAEPYVYRYCLGSSSLLSGRARPFIHDPSATIFRAAIVYGPFSEVPPSLPS